MNSTVFGNQDSHHTIYSFTGFITVIAISMIRKRIGNFFIGANREWNRIGSYLNNSIWEANTNKRAIECVHLESQLESSYERKTR